MIAFHPAQVPGTITVGATGPLSKSGVPNGATSAPADAYNPFDPTRIWRTVENKAYYSNYGTGVMVFAPGGRGGAPFSEPYRVVNKILQGVTSDNIWSACASTIAGCNTSKSFYSSSAGTSMAAPHVSGMAAVLYAEPAIGNVRNAANQLRVKNCILTTTDNIGPATTFGGGRINVKKGVDALAASTC
jgi:subtilisin family serine protease